MAIYKNYGAHEEEYVPDFCHGERMKFRDRLEISLLANFKMVN